MEVQTNPATLIAAHTARLNGEIISLSTSSTGGLDVSFEYGLDSGGPYTETTTPETKTGIEAFYADISGLDAETTYYFRAKGWDGMFTIAITTSGSGGSFGINHLGDISVEGGDNLVVTIIIPDDDVAWFCSTNVDGDWCGAGSYTWGTRDDDGYSFSYPGPTHTPGTITVTFVNVTANHTLEIYGSRPE
jgi:hypothetical protein